MQNELLVAGAKRDANKIISYFMKQKDGLWHLISAVSQIPHFEDPYEETLRKKLCEKASSLYHHSSMKFS